MAARNTKEQIVRALRSTDEPALSAKSLAKKLDVSVRTINNHVGELEDEGQIVTTQIGNATAYYVPFDDIPNHKKPDHSCARCGRAINEHHDFGKVDTQSYFERGNAERSIADFFIFCRFCFEDFISWVIEPAQVGDYRFVHSWNIPDDQLRDVQDDPDVKTRPGSLEHCDDLERELIEYVAEVEDEYDRGVPDHELLSYATKELESSEREATRAIKSLHNSSHVYEPTYGRFKRAQ